MDATAALSLPSRSPLDSLNLAAPQPGQGKASNQEAARMFEGMLMTQLFQAMRKTIPESGLLGEDSQARKTYEYLLDQAVLEHAVRGGKGWGLAERLEKAWSGRAIQPEV